MKTILLFAFLALAVLSIEARTYGSRRPVVKPIVKPIIQPQICPDIPCPRLFIEPQCRRETYYIHNGVQCIGCPEDICRQWQGGAGHWDNDWEFGRNNIGNNWRHRRNW